MAKLDQPGDVHVRSDRRYRFDVDSETLWTAIEATEDYRRWWPWLRRLDAKGLIEGDTWNCVVQPPLPYTLRFTVSLDRVVPGRLAVASIDGEIEGEPASRSTRCRDGDGCDARLVSQLAPVERDAEDGRPAGAARSRSSVTTGCSTPAPASSAPAIVAS